MIKTVASISMPVLETLQIRKNRIAAGNGQKRISIVTGIHGDELEGQYVCYALSERFKAHPEYLNGIVDIYPAMNPLGIDTITRGIPAFDLDMNRLFPGSENGSMTEYLAAKIVEDLAGSKLCVDIHASNIFLTEVPQVRINRLHERRLVPIAAGLNTDLLWVHDTSTPLESTLAYSLNDIGTDTLVVEMGVGMRITKAYGDALVEGILYTMAQMGMYCGPVVTPRTPLLVRENDDICFLNAPLAGIFVQSAKHGAYLQKGDEVGCIVDPLGGAILQRICAPRAGVLFTIREYPVVDEGSLMGRILVCNDSEEKRYRRERYENGSGEAAKI